MNIKKIIKIILLLSVSSLSAVIIFLVSLTYIKISVLNRQFELFLQENCAALEIRDSGLKDAVSQMMEEQGLFENQLKENQIAYSGFLKREVSHLKAILETYSKSELKIIEQIHREISSPSNTITSNKIDPEDLLQLTFNDGFTLYREKEYSSALELFSQTVELYPDDREISFYYFASLYHSDPWNHENFPILKFKLELLSHDMDFAEESLLILVEISLAEDDLEKTAMLYRRLYEFDETNPDYLKALEQFNLSLKSPHEAEDLKNRTIEITSLIESDEMGGDL